MLDLHFFPVDKVHQVLEAGRARWVLGPGRFDLNLGFLSPRAESAVLREDLTAEASESKETGNAANEEQTPEAVQREPAIIGCIYLS